jgi:hypothetical protein
MKQMLKVLALTALTLVFAIGIITACGGRGPNPSSTADNFFSFDWNPAHLLGRTSGTNLADSSGAFIVSAQSTTPGGGNLSGFRDRVSPSSARAATVIFGLGRWSSGSCDDARTPDSSVGVAIPQNGQVGQLSVDAVGTGTAADSGFMELKIIHSDSTETILPITCTLGISNPGARVHCEDKSAAHNTNVSSGDQFSARIFYNGGDIYNAIRVNVQYAVPTF